MDALVFHIAGAVAVVSSLLVVTRKNPVYSALLLVLFFGTVSLQFLVLRSPFLAVIQLLVYAGAIMVLFLFVLMLLNLTEAELRERVSRARKRGAAAGAAGLFLLLAAAISKSPTVRDAPDLAAPIAPGGLAAAGETRPIAETLFRDHVLPFEAASFLILIAIVGAVYLTKKRRSRPAEPAPEGLPAAAADVPRVDETPPPEPADRLALVGEKEEPQ